MQVNFRYQRGGFEESMDTIIKYTLISFLKTHLQLEYSTVNIEFTYQSYDPRLNLPVGADSFIVTADGKAIGFMWYSD